MGARILGLLLCFSLLPEGTKEETTVVHLQQALLCSWGGPLPDDGLCPGVLPTDLPVGCGSGEWTEHARVPAASKVFPIYEMGLGIPTLLPVRVTLDEKYGFGKYPEWESICPRSHSWQSQVTPPCLARATEPGRVGGGMRENGACW